MGAGSGSKAPRVRSELSPCPLSATPALAYICSKREQNWNKRGHSRPPGWAGAHFGVVLAYKSEFWSTTLKVPTMSAPILFRCRIGSKPALFPSVAHASQQWQPSPYLGTASQSLGGLDQAPCVGWRAYCIGHGKSATVLGTLNLISWVSKSVHHLHKQRPVFSQPHCQSPWPSNQPDELILPVPNTSAGCPVSGSNWLVLRKNLRTCGNHSTSVFPQETQVLN